MRMCLNPDLILGSVAANGKHNLHDFPGAHVQRQCGRRGAAARVRGHRWETIGCPATGSSACRIVPESDSVMKTVRFCAPP